MNNLACIVARDNGIALISELSINIQVITVINLRMKNMLIYILVFIDT